VDNLQQRIRYSRLVGRVVHSQPFWDLGEPRRTALRRELLAVERIEDLSAEAQRFVRQAQAALDAAP
jgi:hypothetical protein